MKRAVVVLLVLLAGAGIFLLSSDRSQFVLGGALVNLGFRLQDHLHAYDFKSPHVTPAEVWAEFKEQNELAASVRDRFPRTTEHPVVALLVCMDARIDTSELAGDTRRYYYVVRTAGSVLDPEEQEMLELAVVNGVKLLVLTRHTDCAAEKVAHDPALRLRFPKLSEAVDTRAQHLAQFLQRPLIAERIASGELLVKELLIDTSSDRLLEFDGVAAAKP